MNLRALLSKFVTAWFKIVASASTSRWSGMFRSDVLKATAVFLALLSPNLVATANSGARRHHFLLMGKAPASHLARSKIEFRMPVTVLFASRMTSTSSLSNGASIFIRSRISICGNSWFRIS